MAFAALQLVALIARSLAEARALPNHGMSPMKPQRYTDKERSLGLLASVNLGVLQWVSADGHCFFYAVAAKLKELRGWKGTGLDVRRAAVAEMKGLNMRRYQEMWYVEHVSSGGRTLPAGALSHGLAMQWECYLRDMKEESWEVADWQAGVAGPHHQFAI